MQKYKQELELARELEAEERIAAFASQKEKLISERKVRLFLGFGKISM